jgi:hypothetical protein
MKGKDFFADFWNDLRFATRLFRHSRGFAVTAIAALALGIGASTAIFSAINTVLLQPLPYPHPDRLVQLAVKFPQGNGIVLSVPEFMGMRQATRALADFTLYDFSGAGINLTGGDQPEQLKGIRASAPAGVTEINNQIVEKKEGTICYGHLPVSRHGVAQHLNQDRKEAGG